MVIHMAKANKTATSKYMSGDIRHLINQAIQSELANLPATLAEIKDPIQRLNFLTKLMYMEIKLQRKPKKL